MKKIVFLCLLISLFFIKNISAQKKEANYWFFNNGPGLNFSTTPPTTLSVGQFLGASSACISDQNGNLLFYTSGTTVYNKNHQVMANGSGLFGSQTVNQTALIIKQPLSNTLYYIFTLGYSNGQYNYSIVDMSLAAGMGSVTVKNSPLWYPGNSGTSNVLNGTRHCNGLDYWVVCHELGTTVFHSYLLSATGINTVAVASMAGNSLCCQQGTMKLSPNGKKIALITHPQTTNGEITINDFDNSNGTVSSNSLVLNGLAQYPTGIEFSPNGRYLYGSSGLGAPATSTINTTIRQWDLCAGNEQAVNSSMQILSSPVGTINSGNTSFGQMQIAPDGKIYIGRGSQQSLSQINDPDSSGMACNFVNQGILIYPLIGGSVPNFITSSLRTSPMTLPAHTVNCQDVSFNATQSTQKVCAASGYTILNSHWDFGEPLSAASNTSNALNATHHYSTVGTYTASFIANYQCTSDTLRLVITITNAAPVFSISGKSTICKGETATLTANGAYSYSWSTNSSSASVVISPTINAQYTVVATNSVNGCATTVIYPLTVAKCAGLFTVDNDETEFKIYPNPNDGNFIVETETEMSLCVYDQLGQLVYKTVAEKGKQNFNLSSFKKGIYFVELRNEKTKKVVKLIKTD